MLVRLVRPSRPRRLRAPGRGWALGAAAGAALLLVSCGRRPAAEVAGLSVTWTLQPDPPVVGPARLQVRLRDGDGRPLPGARVRVEANMTHPGMPPVLADAVERGGGRYEAAFTFTMGGDWLLLVSGTLADGRALAHRIEVPRVRTLR